MGSGIDVSSEYPEGRYLAMKVLGSGTYGKVLLCGDAKYKGTGVAIKLVRRDSAPYRKAAKMEAKILRALEGKHGTLKLLRCFEHGGHPCMSFELLGSALSEVLRVRAQNSQAGGGSGTPVGLSSAQVRDVGCQVLSAVSYLHSRGIIHTDVKTDNILLTHGCDWRTAEAAGALRVKLVDFGSALWATEWHPNLVGTMQYRPPEAVLQAGWSFPLDTWGVGCVLCELAVGAKVFCLAHNDVHLHMIERLLGAPSPRT
eukprot:CAMPEP_0174923108 /NCGR_PEP_ID=MMETSP1355-20121228/6361_1 /TAXON_ID=464990 /ORGANISM="Hemiselmis tepida, Strain CCMP443" /LENGTH=256 /DNA_ID=CAMNT_0016168763 /DNA_START=46 /DNA_END=816 /DNA_ORIENTATION=-